VGQSMLLSDIGYSQLIGLLSIAPAFLLLVIKNAKAKIINIILRVH
jgi:hypothetical protein